MRILHPISGTEVHGSFDFSPSSWSHAMLDWRSHSWFIVQCSIFSAKQFSIKIRHFNYRHDFSVPTEFFFVFFSTNESYSTSYHNHIPSLPSTEKRKCSTVIPDITGLFPPDKNQEDIFPVIIFLKTMEIYNAGGFKLELLDPQDRTISVLTPGGGFVSGDPTQQSFSVSLPSKECRGCAVSEHSDHMRSLYQAKLS